MKLIKLEIHLDIKSLLPDIYFVTHYAIAFVEFDKRFSTRIEAIHPFALG